MTFETLYTNWYSRMKNFAREYVISENDAEDIVQEVFTDLYEKYPVLNGQINLVAYIFTSIKNRCIDHLRHQLVARESESRLKEEYYLTLQMKFNSLEVLDSELLKNEESIEDVLENALATLPERCRLIFIKHKIEGKKHSEIAQELNISTKTIENQITIAYKKLRHELRNYVPLLMFLL